MEVLFACVEPRACLRTSQQRSQGGATGNDVITANALSFGGARLFRLDFRSELQSTS